MINDKLLCIIMYYVYYCYCYHYCRGDQRRGQGGRGWQDTPNLHHDIVQYIVYGI